MSQKTDNKPHVEPLPKFNANPKIFIEELVNNCTKRISQLQLQINSYIALRRSYEKVLKRLE